MSSLFATALRTPKISGRYERVDAGVLRGALAAAVVATPLLRSPLLIAVAVAVLLVIGVRQVRALLRTEASRRPGRRLALVMAGLVTITCLLWNFGVTVFVSSLWGVVPIVIAGVTVASLAAPRTNRG